MQGQDYTRLDAIRSGQRRMYDGANIKFIMEQVHDVVKSEKEGRPVYFEREAVSVRWPGQDETVVPVNDQHRQEYPDQYAAFKKGMEQPQEGTPLSEWSPVPRSVALELAYFGIRTVEQLAAAGDDTRRKIGVHSRYCKAAKDWLEGLHSTPNEVARLKGIVEQQAASIERQREQIEKLVMTVQGLSGTRLSIGGDAEMIADAQESLGGKKKKRSVREELDVAS